MSSAYLNLADIAAKTDILNVACSRCGRAGRYRLRTLIERHGPDFPGPDFLRLISADCPKRASTTIYDRCSPYCPDLPKLFGMDERMQDEPQ